MISYKPLRDIFYNNNLVLNELVEAKILTPNNSVVINNDRGYVSLSTINKVMNYLNKEHGINARIEDVLMYVPDTPKQDSRVPKD